MELPQNYNMLSSQERRLVRQEYVRVQKDLCSFCKGNLSQQPPDHIINKRINKRLFPEGFFNYPIHLHHDHDSGKTIGAVHAYCNAVLWQYYGQ
jgi:hypothetical protein